MTCGGVGWYYIQGPMHREATRACDDCRAGKNLQIGPKNVITDKKVPENWSYSKPGRGNSHHDLHRELKRRFNDFRSVQRAIDEQRLTVSDLKKYQFRETA